MGIDREPSFDASRPNQEPAGETGSESCGRTCVKSFKPTSAGTVACSFTDSCPVIALTEATFDVVNNATVGEECLETTFLLTDECFVAQAGKVILAVTPSPQS
ncbi:hypothetical protein KBB49_01875 [Candidatus Saccharibacteria bacterium]|nr:hypothetical protein [Candidatus Saccharibacteria bacterium]